MLQEIRLDVYFVVAVADWETLFGKHLTLYENDSLASRIEIINAKTETEKFYRVVCEWLNSKMYKKKKKKKEKFYMRVGEWGRWRC